MDNSELFSVIILDDDKVSTYLTECVFEDSNLFSCPLVFHDADSALQYIQANCLGSVAARCLPMPHLMVIDVNLPIKGGVDFVEELRKLCPDLKQRTTLCFVSFSGHPRDRKKAAEMGVDCYFEKNLTNAQVQQLGELAKRKLAPHA
jgi:CheY-like chemotaxis protein